MRDELWNQQQLKATRGVFTHVSAEQLGHVLDMLAMQFSDRYGPTDGEVILFPILRLELGATKAYEGSIQAGGALAEIAQQWKDGEV